MPSRSFAITRRVGNLTTTVFVDTIDPENRHRFLRHVSVLGWEDTVRLWMRSGNLICNGVRYATRSQVRLALEEFTHVINLYQKAKRITSWACLSAQNGKTLDLALEGGLSDLELNPEVLDMVRYLKEYEC